MAFSMRTDPRIRQSINQFSSNLESATESARIGCFAFSQNYLEPLYHSIADCCQTTTNSCLPDRRRRRRREFPFDFYNEDAYDEDTNDFMGWGNDELDRLLAGSGANQRSYGGAPTYGPPSGMFYHSGGGSGRSNSILRPPPRRKSAVVPHDGGPDPTIIPNTSALGFLSRIPFMRSTLRYQPSAADLQEHPGRHDEHRGLLSGRRRRSNTASSGETSDSMRSRADLFPSEDEEDAVPLGDEFDIGLRSAGTSETSLAARKGKKKKKSRTSDLGSPGSGRSSRRRGSDRTNGSSIRSGYSVIGSPSSDNESHLANDAVSIQRQLNELIYDEPAEDPQSFPPYESSEHDAHYSETTKPFPQAYRDRDHDNLSVSERRSIKAPTSPALSARSHNSAKPLPLTPDADVLPDEIVSLHGDTLVPPVPRKDTFPITESSRIAIVQDEIRQVTAPKPYNVVQNPEEDVQSVSGKIEEVSDLESDSTLKVTHDDSDFESPDAPPPPPAPAKAIVKEVELRSATQPPSVLPPSSPTEKSLPIPIPSTPHRPSLSKSYTSPTLHKDHSPPSSSPPQLLSKSFSEWTWSKLEGWFPPLPASRDEEWRGYVRNGRDAEVDVCWGAGEEVEEEGVAERWRRSLEVLRDGV